MPTVRPRHYITETDALAAALDAAAERWPGLSRPQLLVRLAITAANAEKQATKDRVDRRRDAVSRHAGALTGVYGADYLGKLREDWPE